MGVAFATAISNEAKVISAISDGEEPETTFLKNGVKKYMETSIKRNHMW